MVLAVAVVAYQLYSTSRINVPEVVTEEAVEVATTTDHQPAIPPPALIPQDMGTAGPTIPLTPYTVYLGKAVAFGTSSPLLMGQELGQAVIGYEWESVDPSPMFDSVSLPQWDSADTQLQNTYEVYVWDDTKSQYVLLGAYPRGQEIQFPREKQNGPRKFKVLGINPALRICPGDRSFTWSFRLTSLAPMSIVRTPVVQTLPFPETCQMR